MTSRLLCQMSLTGPWNSYNDYWKKQQKKLSPHARSAAGPNHGGPQLFPRHTRTYGMHGWMRDFHMPSILLAEQTQHLKKTMIKLVKKTKNEYYHKMVEEATPQNIWMYQR